MNLWLNCTKKPFWPTSQSSIDKLIPVKLLNMPQVFQAKIYQLATKLKDYFLAGSKNGGTRSKFAENFCTIGITSSSSIDWMRSAITKRSSLSNGLSHLVTEVSDLVTHLLGIARTAAQHDQVFWKNWTVWQDWAIYCTLGNFLKPVDQLFCLNCPQS